MNISDRRNTIALASGEALWGGANALVAPLSVLALLLNMLGANPIMIGAISSILGGAVVVTLPVGLYLFRNLRRRRSVLLLWHLLVLVPCFWMLGAITTRSGHWSDAAVAWALLACFCASVLLRGIINGLWQDWMAHLFAARTRGWVFGCCLAAGAAIGTLAATLSGWAISAHPGAAVFAWLYALAGSVGVLAVVALSFIHEPPDAQNAAPIPALTFRDLRNRLQRSFADPNFRAFLVGRQLATFGFCMLPLVAVYFLSEPGGAVPRGRIVSLSAAEWVTLAITALAIGKLGDHRGHRAGLIAGSALQVLTLALLLAGRGPIACLAVYTLIGACNGANVTANFNLMIETCPHDHRLAHLTAGNMVNALGIIVAPLLGGVVAHFWGIHATFILCLAFSLAALCWLTFKLRDPRAAPPLATLTTNPTTPI